MFLASGFVTRPRLGSVFVFRTRLRSFCLVSRLRPPCCCLAGMVVLQLMCMCVICLFVLMWFVPYFECTVRKLLNLTHSRPFQLHSPSYCLNLRAFNIKYFFNFYYLRPDDFGYYFGFNIRPYSFIF